MCWPPSRRPRPASVRSSALANSSTRLERCPNFDLEMILKIVVMHRINLFSITTNTIKIYIWTVNSSVVEPVHVDPEPPINFDSGSTRKRLRLRSTDIGNVFMSILYTYTVLAKVMLLLMLRMYKECVYRAQWSAWRRTWGWPARYQPPAATCS